MPDPAIDFTLIDFPTDRLTVKDLRKRWPHGFDTSPPEDAVGLRIIGPYRRKSLDSIIGSTIDTERELAERAFYAALGKEAPEHLSGSGREESMELLAHTYVGYGLATGEHHALELIRNIETQGAAQARKFRPR
jgi:hypothetical protein